MHLTIGPSDFIPRFLLLFFVTQQTKKKKRNKFVMGAARGNRYKTAKTKGHALGKGKEKSFVQREFRRSNLTMLDRITTTHSPPNPRACLPINISLSLVMYVCCASMYTMNENYL